MPRPWTSGERVINPGPRLPAAVKYRMASLDVALRTRSPGPIRIATRRIDNGANVRTRYFRHCPMPAGTAAVQPVPGFKQEQH